jgi:hypothetical protein
LIYTNTAGLDAPRRGGVTGESEIGSTSDALSLYAIGAFYYYAGSGSTRYANSDCHKVIQWNRNMNRLCDERRGKSSKSKSRSRNIPSRSPRMVPYYARVTVTEYVPIKGQDASDRDSGADYPST